MIDWAAVAASVDDWSHSCHCGCGRRHPDLTGPDCAIAWIIEGTGHNADLWCEAVSAAWPPEVWDMVAEGSPVWEHEP
ncbi:hypothetical protein H4W33_010434 [Kibdelosporangium phytohabitans]|uniref:Uncharacterized protein n=1 Tax=Kibdelosporangium phytohabitans TaxID=860235 RepID=A0A0N9HWZ2_9PSEU|nr:hypothetical protein AOZ06_12860 [Kibdelosporangium phytohabitans]ALG07736.1 hypothetical protein AOZ06_13180 [Kibdelosporangium phytohabitans]MBE1471360.1 hypothetical protein [Kibdelosporangium phytohabitans]